METKKGEIPLPSLRAQNSNIEHPLSTHCRTFSISGFYPLDASSTAPPHGNKTRLQNVPREENSSPIKNQWARGSLYILWSGFLDGTGVRIHCSLKQGSPAEDRGPSQRWTCFSFFHPFTCCHPEVGMCCEGGSWLCHLHISSSSLLLTSRGTCTAVGLCEAWTAWPCLSWLLLFSLEMTGRGRQTFLQCV